MQNSSIGFEIPVGTKVAFLREPDAYPVRPANVEVIETHMSWVFLADAFVYKLKKPVRHAFLDFSTLDARHLNCEREVELNRRLAAGVYGGVVPLVMRSDGRLQLDGEGTVVDWLVKMRRLPAQRMLDAAICSKTVSGDDIKRLGQTLTEFYRHAAPVTVSTHDYRGRFEDDVRANYSELARQQFGLPVSQLERLARAQLAFIAQRGAVLELRALENRIIDAHGDLRPEHICLTPEPVIIDCLEFKLEYRLLDPVDELAYLAMECERLGAGSIGDQLLRQRCEAAGDAPPAALIWFYKAFRACLRAKIAIWHIADHQVRDADKWRRRALDYLALADTYARNW